jgi:hemoglobin/transferrin/lactoferrin receptor protein
MIEHSSRASMASDSNVMRIHSLRTLLGSTVLASVLMTGVSTAFAQNVTTLSSTQVTMLQRLVITSTRSTQRVLDVPATISVIGKDQLDKRVVRDIQDLVRTEPGISVDRQTSVGYTAAPTSIGKAQENPLPTESRPYTTPNQTFRPSA